MLQSISIQLKHNSLIDINSSPSLFQLFFNHYSTLAVKFGHNNNMTSAFFVGVECLLTEDFLAFCRIAFQLCNRFREEIVADSGWSGLAEANTALGVSIIRKGPM